MLCCVVALRNGDEEGEGLELEISNSKTMTQKGFYPNSGDGGMGQKSPTTYLSTGNREIAKFGVLGTLDDINCLDHHFCFRRHFYLCDQEAANKPTWQMR